jgi:hypothetical protein
MDLPPERRKAQSGKPESPMKKVPSGLERRGEARAEREGKGQLVNGTGAGGGTKGWGEYRKRWSAC